MSGRIYVYDPETPFAIDELGGGFILTIRNRTGKTIYQAPFNSKEDVGRVPAELRNKVCEEAIQTCNRSIEGMRHVWNTPGMRQAGFGDPGMAEQWVQNFLAATQIDKLARPAMPDGDFALQSNSFQDGDDLPLVHSRYGANKSPHLAWGNPPDGTAEYALICEEDSENESPVLWVVYGIPPDVRELPMGLARTPVLAMSGGVKQGTNDFGTIGYTGPKPEKGAGQGTYRFTLYALSKRLGVKPKSTAAILREAMDDHVLEEVSLSVVFEKL